MFTYRMAVNCPNCGSLAIQEGSNTDMISADVVCLSMFSQQSFHCDNCGVDVFTGNVEDTVDYKESTIY